MCGLAGLYVVGETDEVSMRPSLRAMCDAMIHRGPDAEGLWSSHDSRCALGHRRLAIIDLDPRSNQPMHSADQRYTVVFNGEIYNFQALRRELEAAGIVLRTSSDTEVLLEGYALWGPGVFGRLDGMFALAIHDTLTRRLVLARDRLGEKPLYHTTAGGLFAFASELKPLLLVPGVSVQVGERGLFDYFTLRYVPEPATIFDDIHALQPGTYRIVHDDGRSSEHAFHAYDIEPARLRGDDYVDALEAALTESVRTRLVADVPVGALLSSGVDSSLVCALAAGLTNRGIHCFGAGFAGDPEDETPQARAIAEHLGLPFEALTVSADDLASGASGFGARLDEPNGDRSCVPTYLLSRLIRSHVTVAVSGDGGDELFAGYGRYAVLARDAALQEGPANGRVEHYLAKGLPVFDRNVLDDAFPGEAARFRARFASRFASLFARDELDAYDRLRMIDLHSYLPGAVLAKVDRMAMKHSLEVRTPFFSPQVLALSSRLPRELVQDRGLLKIALRRLLARHLPPELIQAKKQGFGMPAAFFGRNEALFRRLAERSDEVLRAWAPLRDRPGAWAALQHGARANINSLWGWTVLGQWVESLPARG